MKDIKAMKTRARKTLGMVKRIALADHLKPVHNSNRSRTGQKYLVYQNHDRAPGLMTHAARVLCFSEYAERRGMFLVVDMKSYFNMNLDRELVGKENSWEYYYEQPFGRVPSLDDILTNHSFWFTPEHRSFLMGSRRDVQASGLAKTMLRFKRSDFIDSSVLNCLAHRDVYLRCCEVYQKYVRFNAATKEYTDMEYEKLLKGKRVIGVGIRGTDYSVRRTFGHHIQPEIDDVIVKTQDYMKRYGYDYIYLSCEEYAAVEKFESAFPGKVIINNRKFFDQINFKGRKTGIWDCGFDRENDAMLRGLEYLSSMNLLSKCHALIAGINTGTQMAYIMNNDQYEHVYFYSLGKYGIDD